MTWHRMQRCEAWWVVACGSVRPWPRASVQAETYPPIPPSLTTPDQVDTSIGTLKFRDGIPDQATADKVYDQLDLQRGVSAYLNGLRGVSIYAARKGIRDAGVKDNDVLIFSGLMDAQSLFLTANADTVYFISNIDLTKGPMVVETPPDTLGLFDDLWFRWVIDFGAPGPDRGLGGKYLLLPPAMTARCPKAAISSAARPRRRSRCSAAPSSSTTTRSRRSRRSRRRSRSIPTFRGLTARASATFVTGKAPLAPLSKPGTLQPSSRAPGSP